MTLLEIKKWLSQLTSLLGFEYKGKNGYIDPINQHEFVLFYDGNDTVVDSLDKAMSIKFFDGLSLEDIYHQITITDC